MRLLVYVIPLLCVIVAGIGVVRAFTSDNGKQETPPQQDIVSDSGKDETKNDDPLADAPDTSSPDSQAEDGSDTNTPQDNNNSDNKTWTTRKDLTNARLRTALSLKTNRLI